MKVIKTGIIGSGFMGSSHIEALNRVGGVKILAIASDDEQGMKSLADKFGILNTYTDWKEVINNPEIEVIHNCTPNYLHFEINKAAILAGKHIISEKPLTLNSSESSELVELTKKHNVVNAINFNYRFYPLIQHLKAIVRKGEIGDIYYIHGHYLQDWLFYNTDYNWRLETELSGQSRAVADIGSHWCDTIQFITGQKIKKVFSNLKTIHENRKKPEGQIETFKGLGNEIKGELKAIEITTEDAGTVLFELEDSTNGVFTVSQVSAGRKNNFVFEIDGSKKSLYWDQENPNKIWIGYRDKANEVLLKDPSLIDPAAQRYAHYPGGHPEGYPDGPKNLFINVYNFIREGKDPNSDEKEFPTFEDGHYENRIVDAVLRSNKEQKWTEV